MRLLRQALTDLLGRRQDNFNWRAFQEPLDLDAVENVCVLHLSDKLGDAILLSPLVDALARARPGLPVFVGTSAAYAEYWRRHPTVREIAVLPPNRRRGRSSLRRLREALAAARPWRGRFDVLVDTESFAEPERFALLRALRARRVIGFNGHAYRLFDVALDEGRFSLAPFPIVLRAVPVLRALGRDLDPASLRFHAPFGPEDLAAAQAVVDVLPGPGPRLLFNVYGAAPFKHLRPESVATAVRLIREVDHRGPIYLSLPPGSEAPYRNSLDDENLAFVPPMRDAFGLFALVAAMDAVVSPDTGVSHVAAALGKPQTCLFAQAGGVPTVWGPYGDLCEGVVSTSGQDVNDLDWDVFAAAVRRTLDRMDAA